MAYFRYVSLVVGLVIMPTTLFAAGAWYKQDAAVMGTPVHVELWSKDKAQARRLIRQVLDEFRRIDALMSHYKEDSQLSKINRLAAKQPVVVERELFDVIEHALHMSQVTGGAFDITYASVGQFYDFRKGKKPTRAMVMQYLPAINYHHVQLNTQTSAVRYLHDDVHIDLGGIAKGFAVDKAVALLQRAGIRHAYVSAGGDSRLLGDKNGRPWLVGIQHPRDKKQLIASLPLADASVSTSGDYERFYMEDGVRIHHIIDPDTGGSAYRVRSVTVVGTDCFTTDALSTGVFVLGVKKGLALIETMAQTEVVIVDHKGRLFFSSGFSKKK